MATQCHNQLTLGFNRRSFSILTAVRLPATRAFCSCASSMRNWRSLKNLRGFSTTRRHPLFIEHHTHEMLCQRIYRYCRRRPGWQRRRHLAQRSPTFQTIVGKSDPLASQPTLLAWRIRPMSKPSNGLAPWVLSGFCSMVTKSEKPPRKSYYILMPPTNFFLKRSMPLPYREHAVFP